MADKKITLTEDELNAFMEAKLAEREMPDDERKVRGVVREEVARALGDFFEQASDGDDDGDKGGKNRPGGAGAEPGLFDKLAEWVGGGSGDK
jgi:hypothetical protein